MAATNSFVITGVVLEEPMLKKLSGGKVMANTIVKVVGGENTIVPIVAFNKKAHILCALAHKGSQIYAKGVLKSKTHITSEKGKTLIELILKVTDFAVLVKEPIQVEEGDYVDIVKLYDPELITDEEEDT